MLTKDKIITDYKFFKNQAKKAVANKNYNKAILCIEAACKIAYTINFIFADYELENLTQKISSILLTPKKNYGDLRNVILYDCFALPNRGLTQQYLRALSDIYDNILFIVRQDESDLDVRIKKEVECYSNVNICFINSKNNSRIKQIALLYNIISLYKPSKAFLHMTPWDVVGVVTWNAFIGVERYQINLTDHAFWLGISCSDYILEFRNYGFNISMLYRHIDKRKLLILPYYPIAESSTFLGLPETSLKHAVKLFSGGATYKINGHNGLFYDLIRDVLNRNPNTIFYYAGPGDMRIMHNYIIKNKLQERWFILGNRNDIVELMKNVDIFIGTYPLSGGLMTQIAALTETPVITLTDPQLNMTNINELFIVNKNMPVISYYNLSLFNKKLDILIDNLELRKKEGHDLCKCLTTPNIFVSNLKQLILNKSNIYNINHININTKSIEDFYLDNVNIMPYAYYNILINKYYAIYMNISFIKAVIYCLIYGNKIKYIKKIANLIGRS